MLLDVIITPVAGAKITSMERGNSKLRDTVAVGGFGSCFLVDYFYQPLHESQIGITALFILVPYLIFSAYVEHHDRRNNKAKLFGPIAFRFAFLIFLFPIILFTNGALDYSVPVEKQSVVIEKHVRTGRAGASNYYLKIEPLDPNDEYLIISVPAYIYGQARENFPVTIELHKGFFAIPWIGNLRFFQPSR